MSIEWQATPESEPVEEIGYDQANEEVWVVFRSSARYVYSNVPPAVWEELRTAPSKGSFVNTVLKSGYPYRRA